MRLPLLSYINPVALTAFLILFCSAASLFGQSTDESSFREKAYIFKAGERLELAYPILFGESGQTGFRLVNEAGETLFTHSVYGECGESNERIVPLGILEPGTYILLEHDGSRRKTETVVIVEP
jgi:hypothetical protein